MILYQNFSRMLTATQKRSPCSIAAHLTRPHYVVEVELFLSIGWSCRIRDVGRLSRNRVVLVFDPKDGWLVVGMWLLDGWKMVVEHFCRG